MQLHMHMNNNGNGAENDNNHDNILPVGVYAAAALILCGTLAAGTFFDLEVSQALYKPLDPFFLVITILGQYLHLAFNMLLVGALFRQALACESIDRTRRKVYLAVCVYLAVSGSVSGAFPLLHEECLGAFDVIASLPQAVTIPAVILLMYAPLFFAGYFLSPHEYDRRLVGKLIRMMLFIIAVLLLTGIAKFYFARPRYRTTLAGYEDVGFRPWYSPGHGAEALAQKFGCDINAFRSFPSGHALMNASAVCLFPMFSQVFTKLPHRNTALAAAGVIWTFAVMLSRIVLGAHYLSDVSIGALIGLCASFGYVLIEKRISGDTAQPLRDTPHNGL